MTASQHKMFDTGVRESMHCVPSFFQPILTWLTGKPLRLDEARLVLPPWLDVIVTPMLTIMTVAALARIGSKEPDASWLTIPLLWLVLVGLLRKMQVTHLHHAIHGRLFTYRALNTSYATLVPSLLVVQNAAEYKREHFGHHDMKIFTTHRDSDAAFLSKLGFIPARTQEVSDRARMERDCTPGQGMAGIRREVLGTVLR